MASLSTTSLTFTSQNVVTTSAVRPKSLSNTGNAALSIVASGDFSQTNKCNGQIGVNAACKITITFKPTATGSRTGTIKANAIKSPQTISLAGTGI